MTRSQRHAFELRTPRLFLREIQKTDLDDLVELDQDPEVMRFINGGVPTPREAYLGPDGLLARMRAHAGAPYGYAAAFEVEAETALGPFAGWFHLRPSVFNEGLLEVGYRLRRACWNKGLATEGARALTCYSVHTLGLPAVDGCTLPHNTASIRVLEKCAMQATHTFRHPRAPVDVLGFVAKADLIRRQPWFRPA